MNRTIIDGSSLLKMIHMGAENLSQHKDIINKLNVFPVPDGDTGTNMNLSMTSGVDGLKNLENERLSTIGRAFTRGLLMGARGNSGVILSQLFRGFSEHIEQITEINRESLAAALTLGVETAYKSVTNPVEGTILTVAKDAATVARKEADKVATITELMEKIVAESRASLERTPDLLPILKEVGVVDSGGKGLVIIFEGFLAALKGEALPEQVGLDSLEALIELEHNRSVQSFVDIESIEYGYCTEFIVNFTDEKLAVNAFEEADLRSELSKHGDSLLLAVDQDFFKVHIHAEYPGEVMTIVQRYGDLTNIDIENMRIQYEEIVSEETEVIKPPLRDSAIIAVTTGSGIGETFKSIGATAVIEGGQTMNPSTEDFLLAIKEVNASTVFLLPNNSNIILAANQAKELSDVDVIVIPTKSIPQGISALFVFDENDATSAQENEREMLEAMGDVKTGQVTYAIRDTVINDLTIAKGNFMGIEDSEIKVTDIDKLATAKLLVDEMIDEDAEIITIFYGEDVTEAEAEKLIRYIEEKHEEVEAELHAGNQTIYSYIYMVE